MLCFIMMTISNVLMGPSDTLKLEFLFVPLFFIGQGLNGFSQGFLFIPVLPEVIDALYTNEKMIEGEDEMLDAIVSDRAAGLYGMFYAAGTISAPLFGSFIYESVLNKNWALTCDFFAAIGAVYSIIFLVFNVLPDITKEKKENAEIAEKIISTPHTLMKARSMISSGNQVAVYLAKKKTKEQ